VVSAEAQPILPRRKKTLRNVTITIAAAATITAGAATLTISGSSTGSATSGGSLSVRVKIDLNKALDALAAILGFRTLEGPASQASGPSYHPDCAKSATGKVQQFLTLHPCKQFATATRTIAKSGTTAQIAFSWVEMPTSAIAGKYKAKVDTPGTGNPPGASLAFNGYCYASGQKGATVWTMLVRPTGHVDVDREILQIAAREKLGPSYLQQHCIN
jgi:hypothetical protein